MGADRLDMTDVVDRHALGPQVAYEVVEAGPLGVLHSTPKSLM